MRSSVGRGERMSHNIGKSFEDDFKQSVPKDCYYLRLHDSATGFLNQEEKKTVRFSLKSPYDVILCKDGKMTAVELKTVGGCSASFGTKSSDTIKLRQIEELLKAKEQGRAKAFLVIHFRRYGETYAIDPETFLKWTETCHRKSFPISAARTLGIRLPERKLKVHFRYDLTPLISESG